MFQTQLLSEYWCNYDCVNKLFGKVEYCVQLTYITFLYSSQQYTLLINFKCSAMGAMYSSLLYIIDIYGAYLKLLLNRLNDLSDCVVQELSFLDSTRSS